MHNFTSMTIYFCLPDWFCNSFTKPRIHWNKPILNHFYLASLICMYTNTENHTLSALTVCDWFKGGGRGEGLIHSQLWSHMVQASLHTPGSMTTPHNHSCAGPGESQSWAKTQLTLPQAQPTGYLHHRLDTAWPRGEEGCACFFVSVWGGVPTHGRP